MSLRDGALPSKQPPHDRRLLRKVRSQRHATHRDRACHCPRQWELIRIYEEKVKKVIPARERCERVWEG